MHAYGGMSTPIYEGFPLAVVLTIRSKHRRRPTGPVLIRGAEVSCQNSFLLLARKSSCFFPPEYYIFFFFFFFFLGGGAKKVI